MVDAGMFGAVLRETRRRAGLSQEGLAAVSGVSVRGIRAIEGGRTSRPRPGTVRVLADALTLTGTDRARFLGAAFETSDTRPDGDPVPAQLPADLSGFTGRREELALLDGLLDAVATAAAPGLCVLTGTAGVGKTTLALHWAHHVAHRFPDGQLYIDLRGFHPAGPPARPDEALRGFFDAFGVPPRRIPVDTAAQSSRFRSLLAGRRVVLVLDNAVDDSQIRPLLPGSPGCMTLVTSRNALLGLVAVEAACPIELDVPKAADARALLAARIGNGRVGAEPAAVEKIVSRCARLPLALAITAARAATRPGLALADLAAELDGGAPLAALHAGDAGADVRSVLSWSYRALSDGPARLFRLIGLHPGPACSVAAAAALAGQSPEAVRLGLEELVESHLVREPAPGRYAMHDLLRAYAAGLVAPEERGPALGRLLGHYLHTGYAATLLLDAYRDPVDLEPAPVGAQPLPMPSTVDALAWFRAEREVLIGAVRTAVGEGLDDLAWQLAWTLETFLDRDGRWADWAVTQTLARDAAQRRGNLRRQLRSARDLGHVAFRRGMPEESRRHLEESLALSRRAGAVTDEGHAHRGLAMLLSDLGRHDQAARHAEEALRCARAVGHLSMEADALNNLGWELMELGDASTALAHCTRARDMHARVGDRHSEAAALDSMGLAYLRLGDAASAVDHLRRALELYGAAADQLQQALTLANLAEAHEAAGDLTAARGSWQRALDILTGLEHPLSARARSELHRLLPARPVPPARNGQVSNL